jgi:competence protein ComEC
MYHTLTHIASHVHEKIQSSWMYVTTQERQNLFHWLPVGLGVGIGIYFALPVEPPIWVGLGFLISVTLLSLLLRHSSFLFLTLPLSVIALGFVLIQYRTYSLATPLLQKPTEYPIRLTGRVLAIEQQPNGTRLTLDDVLYNTSRKDIFPHKIRVVARGRLKLKESSAGATLSPGQYIQIKAMLLPPKRPAMPGAYDFRRKAYFDGIGAVGYVVAPIKVEKVASPRLSSLKSFESWISSVRHRLTVLFRQAIPGQAGEIAAALVTGDRSGITEETRRHFADAGIAHILAISGLHLSILSGISFLAIRGSLSFIPHLSLRYPTKKISAVIAIVATSFYLFICGATIPAQRAKIQTTLVLGAILLDRQAITMRNVALGATVILVLLPESLISVSFQLSFSAVIALVAGYQIMQPYFSRWNTEDRGFIKRLLIYLVGISFSSLLATAATLPFTIYTFHKFTLTAVLTNLLAIPLVSFIIMPLIILFLFSLLISSNSFLASLLGAAIKLMMGLAAEVSTWTGSLIQVPSLSVNSLLFFIIGALWLSLWTTKLRRLGLIPLSFSLVLPWFSRPPDLFINEDGTLVALRDTQGRGYVNSLQAGRFARKTWSEAFACKQVERMSIRGSCRHAAFETLAHNILSLKSKRHSVRLLLDRDLSPHVPKIEVVSKGHSLFKITPDQLQKKGGHLLWLNKRKVGVISVEGERGKRPWT